MTMHIMCEKQFLEQILWHNSLVRTENSPIFYQEWFDRGITKVKHLKNASNSFLSLVEMQRKYSFNFCPLKYFGLISTCVACVAFASKALTDTEKRYAGIEREMLAVVYGCDRFHTYLFSNPPKTT